jgi:hypothetical protein
MRIKRTIMTRRRQPRQYAICVKNRGYSASLELRKVYRLIPDSSAAARQFVRVVDESGEDYLYPEDFFVPIEVPEAAKTAFSRAS